MGQRTQIGIRIRDHERNQTTIAVYHDQWGYGMKMPLNIMTILESLYWLSREAPKQEWSIDDYEKDSGNFHKELPGELTLTSVRILEGIDRSPITEEWLVDNVMGDNDDGLALIGVELQGWPHKEYSLHMLNAKGKPTTLPKYFKPYIDSYPNGDPAAIYSMFLTILDYRYGITNYPVYSEEFFRR